MGSELLEDFSIRCFKINNVISNPEIKMMKKRINLSVLSFVVAY